MQWHMRLCDRLYISENELIEGTYVLDISSYIIHLDCVQSYHVFSKVSY